ncbi:O-antigen ligase family protein [uncultured Helicobacter sp.]|uniref:O-antigen ligase family protein n=1 Tax=uncultured Helicobacter sp. TaxID=175537 RepID=UPI00374E91DA
MRVMWWIIRDIGRVGRAFLARYHDEISLVLFCVGLGLYGLGLSGFSLSFRAQSFFHIGGLLYIVFAYRCFSREDLRALRVPFITFGVVIVLGLLTYFDDVMPQSFGKVWSSVNTHIIKYLVLFVVMFLYVRHTKRRNVLILLGFFGLMCMLNVGGTLLEFWQHDFRHDFHKPNLPFYFDAIYTYQIWLIAPLALCISGVVACRYVVLKIACALGAVLTIVAMMANGERSFLVAAFVMVFVPFVVWHYRYKARILVFVVFFVIPIVLSAIYVQTKSLPERYNVAHMVDNFWEVIHTPVAAMGKYDKICFGWAKCNAESTKNGKAKFFWEHSSLSRLAMSKSTFEAFLDAPFTPRLVGVFQTGAYLWQYYESHPHRQQNRMYVSIGTKLNGYVHTHNHILALLFCYGIFGFGAIAWFWIFGFSMASKAMYFTQDSLGKLLGLFFYIFVCGMIMCALFESFYNNILEVLFILMGCVYGFLSLLVKPPRAAS